jgi:3-oxoacyl-[acyl-carrier protein] reductase
VTIAIDLTRSVVLVTGGSRGIGAAIVRALHSAGASVFFTFASRRDDAKALADELGDGVAFAQCDLADGTALPELVGACVSRFGGLHTLVNNAGTFDVNPFDGADLAWAAMRHMRGNGGGRIINIASRAAHRGELDFADYGASKAALVNLTKSIARSCAKDGVLAFAVAPGFIETEMAARDLATRRDEIVAEIPIGWVGTPEHVAGIVAFLASPMGDYLNGATIDVNGGSYVR